MPGYIYCPFYTCLEHILIFNINLVSLGVIRLVFLPRSLKGCPQFPKSDGKPDDAPLGEFLRGPHFLGEFQNWKMSHRVSRDKVPSSHFNPNIPSPMMNKLQKTPYLHNCHFIFAGTYSGLHHSHIDLVMCPHIDAETLTSFFPKHQPHRTSQNPFYDCFKNCLVNVR